MATSTKKLDGTGLAQVWSIILASFVAQETGKGLSTNDFSNEFKQKLTELNENAQENVIEKISVNGVELQVSEKGVDISVPTGALASLDKIGQAQLEDALLTLINGKATAATTLAGYNISDAFTKDEVNEAISTAVGNAIAGVYKVKGTIAFANLPSEGMKEGWIYNISDAFTTNTSFVEGVGKGYPAGTNVVWTENGWDCQAGTYDFSDFLMESDLVDLTEAEIADICKMPTL